MSCVYKETYLEVYQNFSIHSLYVTDSQLLEQKKTRLMKFFKGLTVEKARLIE